VERGTVKWFNEDKGFGLIAPESGGSEVFVHHTYIEGQDYPTLADGQTVEFEATGQPHRTATRVRRI
jgi:CspA family cold shock protein